MLFTAIFSLSVFSATFVSTVQSCEIDHNEEMAQTKSVITGYPKYIFDSIILRKE